MPTHAYLGAPFKKEQMLRERDVLTKFSSEQNLDISAFYFDVEPSLKPKLSQLMNDSADGDVLLITHIGSLFGLSENLWQELKVIIKAKNIAIVPIDLPTSFIMLSGVKDESDLTKGMIVGIQNILLEIVEAQICKEKENRRQLQAVGIERAKAQGAYTGRLPDQVLHRKIKACLLDGMSIRKTAELVGCAVSTVQRIKAEFLPPL